MKKLVSLIVVAVFAVFLGTTAASASSILPGQSEPEALGSFSDGEHPELGGLVELIEAILAIGVGLTPAPIPPVPLNHLPMPTGSIQIVQHPWPGGPISLLPFPHRPFPFRPRPPVARPVPEPGAALAFGMGTLILGMALRGRRRVGR